MSGDFRLGRSFGAVYPLSELVKCLWDTLAHCYIYQATELGQRGLSLVYQLLGWEFKDILEGQSILPLKEKDFGLDSCGWDVLAQDILLLMCFCE